MNLQRRVLIIAWFVPSLAFSQPKEVQERAYALALQDWRNFAAQTRAARERAPEWAKALFSAWEEEEKKPNQGKLFELVTTPKDAREMSAALGWLRSRILLDKADARYSFAYSANLFSTRDNTGDYRLEAAQLFLQGKHSIRVDAARCADSSAPVRKIVGYESQLEKVAKFIEGIQPRARTIARVMAVALEDFVGPRDRQAWLCAVEATNSKIEFIEDGSWLDKRREYLDLQRTQAFASQP